MKRKFKLLASISAFALCLAMLVFGVYSASTVNYTSSGTLRYTVKDVFVEIHTKVYRSTVNTTKTQNELNATQSVLESSSNLATTATAQNLVDMNYGISIEEVGGENVEVDATELKSYTSNSITSPNATLSKTLNDFAFEYDEYDANNTKSYAYYIVVTVENNGNSAVGVTATLTIPAISNTLSKATGNKNIPADGTQNFVFATALDDPMSEVDTTFSYTLSIGKNTVSTLSFSKKELSACTPAQIQEVGRKGHINPSNNTQWLVDSDVWFTIGDTISFKLNDSENENEKTEVVMELADFNHDKDVNNQTIPFTFVTKYLLPTTYNYAMNTSSNEWGAGTNIGGWPQSSMRSYLNDENDVSSIISLMPEEWRTAIVPAVKSTHVCDGQGNSATTEETSIDKLFLLSRTEVYVQEENPNFGEGTMYQIFICTGSRLKSVKNGSTGDWWLRSPFYGDSMNFYLIEEGTYGCQDASCYYGVVFAFCL